MKFTVSDGGTRVTEFRGLISGACGSFNGITFTAINTYVSSMSVAPDGSFSGTETVSSTTTEVTGKLLSDGTATGNVKASFSSCAGNSDWSAVRG